MADQSERFPRLPGRQWWALRDRFKQSIPTRVTPSYLAAALDMQEKSAAANVLPALRAVGLIDEDGKPTQLAVRWRDDDLYPDVIEEIRSALYPTELREAIPNPADNRTGVERWFATRTGHGLSAAKKMAAFYELLFAPVQVATTQEKERPAAGQRIRDQEGTAPRVPQRNAPESQFKLPGSSYSELERIIRGYIPFRNPVSLEEVAQATGGMHPTNISRNTGFLVSLGVLEGGPKKVLSDRGRKLATALDHQLPAEISAAWRDILGDQDFIQRTLSAVRIRGGMDAETLQTHIAYSAGQPRTQTALAGSGAVVDVLRAADMLRESEGKLFAASQAPTSQSLHTQVPSSSEQAGANEDYVDSVATPQIGGVSLTIQIQLQCSASELETLGPRIRTLLEEVRRARSVDPQQD